MGLHRQLSFLARVTVATGIVAALISAGIVVANPVVASARTTYTWTQMAPATSPSARRAASMAYDTATGDMVLFGVRSSYTRVHSRPVRQDREPRRATVFAIVPTARRSPTPTAPKSGGRTTVASAERFSTDERCRLWSQAAPAAEKSQISWRFSRSAAIT